MPAPRRNRKPIPPALNSQRTGNQLGKMKSHGRIEFEIEEFHGLVKPGPREVISLNPRKTFGLDRRDPKKKVHRLEDRGKKN